MKEYTKTLPIYFCDWYGGNRLRKSNETPKTGHLSEGYKWYQPDGREVEIWGVNGRAMECRRVKLRGEMREVFIPLAA